MVDLTGAGFTPTSTVQFNGVSAAAVSYVSSSELKATVPAGASTGKITVTNTDPPQGTVISARQVEVTS